MNQPKKVEQIYKILLEGTTDKIEKATYYYRLGWAKDDQREYGEALALYEKSLGIRQESLPPNHPELTKSYNSIGNVYRNMGEYSKALSYYEKRFSIEEQSLPPNQPQFAASHYNMGFLYEKMGNYAKACPFYERAVQIGQKSLPSNHPELQRYRRELADIKKEIVMFLFFDEE